jgi:hypothetical protein
LLGNLINATENLKNAKAKTSQAKTKKEDPQVT